MMMIRTGAASIALAAATVLAAGPLAAAAIQAPQRYDLPAQDLGTSLRTVARVSGRQVIIATDAVAGRTAAALHGVFGADAALSHLLAGTGIPTRFTAEAVLVGGEIGASSTNASSSGIIVTGSRIRGAAPTSETLSLSQSSIIASGMIDLGEVARSLPQSFGGSQNPGVGNGAPFPNENINGASSLNLRGLGADATLTLINGHRVAYSSLVQAIDVTIVPVAALDRLEIVPDGASAIYGSDAVGGVANIILKPDFAGLTTSAHVGGSTDGGGLQQQYSAVAGDRWRGGGLMLAGNLDKDTAITAAQRSYTDTMSPAATLVPGQRQYAFVAAGHQQIVPGVTFEIDTLFSNRRTELAVPLSTDPDLTVYGYTSRAREKSFEVAPKVKIELPHRWTGTLTGMYGFDRSRYAVDFFVDQAPALTYGGCYCNTAQSAEAAAEGPILGLPGGDARLALGGGYRRDTLHASRDDDYDFHAARRNIYGYAELALPIFGPANARPLLRRLTLTGAVRYESYPGLAHLATPKLGLSYEPTRDLGLKATWGRSFKTPTLYQSFFPNEADLLQATQAGCVSCTSNQTVLDLGGGNPALKPETASTGSVTVEIHPAAVAGLKVAATYFRIRYRNRVATPITPFSTALSNPQYRSLVTLNPSAATLSGVIDAAQFGLYNITDQTYDPADVYALIDDRYVNVSRQAIDGVDVIADYRMPVSDRTSLSLAANASYLRLRQSVIAGQAAARTSGTIFNPPSLRGRGSVVFEHRGATFGAYVNYIGGVRDNRFARPAHVGSLTTVDLTSSYAFASRARWLRDLQLVLSVQNIANAKPARIAVTDPSYTTYDSTNYSAAGRVVGLTISKHW